jgi:hypothetical protein
MGNPHLLYNWLITSGLHRVEKWPSIFLPIVNGEVLGITKEDRMVLAFLLISQYNPKNFVKFDFDDKDLDDDEAPVEPYTDDTMLVYHNDSSYDNGEYRKQDLVTIHNKLLHILISLSGGSGAILSSYFKIDAHYTKSHNISIDWLFEQPNIKSEVFNGLVKVLKRYGSIPKVKELIAQCAGALNIHVDYLLAVIKKNII